VHQDVGHALVSLAFAAASQGCAVTLLESVTDASMTALLRPQDPEDAICLVSIHPFSAATPTNDWWRSVQVDPNFWEGERPCVHRAQSFESYYGRDEARARPIVAAARIGSRKLQVPNDAFWRNDGPPCELDASWASAGPLRPFIHQRRSAQGFDASMGPLRRSTFDVILQRFLRHPLWLPWDPIVQPMIFVHRVEGLDSGVYLLPRGTRGLNGLKGVLAPAEGRFLWEPVPGTPTDVPLLLLERGDIRDPTKLASCVQDIASDSAFAVAFLMEYLPVMEHYGSWMYRRGHWEACALGGALYLAAEAAGEGLQGTGIGCFFGPWVHAWLDVDATAWQDVCHFTVGWPEKDTRVQNLAPYHHLDALKGSNRDTTRTDY